jgi:uncharacterized protein (DUF302 family)
VVAAVHLALLATGCLLPGNEARSADSPARPGTIILQTPHRFEVLRDRLKNSIKNNGMGLIAETSASHGAATRGINIPGNAVIMVFRNDYAVRMLNASVPAGIEAPLRFYLAEQNNNKTTLIYQLPSVVFAPYASKELNEMALELDGIFRKITSDAVKD